MAAELSYYLHWQRSEVLELDARGLRKWHSEVRAIHERAAQAAKGTG